MKLLYLFCATVMIVSFSIPCFACLPEIPDVDVQVTPSNSVCVGKTVFFDASGSSCGDPGTLQFTWIFPPEAYNIYIYGDRGDFAQCKFSPADNYDVNLKVKNLSTGMEGQWQLVAGSGTCGEDTISVGDCGSVWYVSVDGNDDYNGQYATYQSDDNGPFRTIQTAIDSASDGDEVIVASGNASSQAVYYEQLDMKGKNLNIHSDDPDNWEAVENTVIDGQMQGSTVVFRGNETTPTTGANFEGITINGGGPAEDGLALHLELNETTGMTASDSSDKTRDGTLHYFTEGSQWVDGVVDNGKALNFDGIDDYVEVDGYKGVVGRGARTCAAWIKTGNLGQSNSIVQWGTDAAGQLWMFYVYKDGTVAVSAYGGGTQSNAVVADGQWHHVAAVLEEGESNSSNIKLYVDGVLDTVLFVAACPMNTSSDSTVHIGVWDRPIAGTKTNYFNGLIDDVQIYSRALTSEEIQERADRLIAHWKLDESSDSSASDSSLNGYDGTLVGNPSWAPTGGQIGGALDFDGVDDYVTTPLLMDSEEITVSAWINAETWRTYRYQGTIVSNCYWGDGSKRGFSLRAGDSGVLSFAYGDSTNNWEEAYSGSLMDQGVWYHVAGTFNGSYIRIYINGEKVDEVPTTDGIAASDHTVWIARNACDQTRKFDGLIDDVRIYNRALTEAEIQELTNQLIAHWKLDDNCDDATGNGHTGTAQGTSAPDYADGMVDKSISLDGTDQYIQAPYVLNPAQTAFSAFAWVKGGDTSVGIISQVDDGVGGIGRYWLGINLNGELWTALRTSGQWGLAYAGSSWDTTNWHHIGVVWDGDRRHLYLDGKKVAADASSIGSLEACTGGLYIGTNKTAASGQFWPGFIDDVRIYNYALNDGQVLSVYQSRFANGGGIKGHGASVDISQCIIKDNTSETNGGGLSNVNGEIANCFIISNKADNADGGGLADCDGNIINSVIADNTARNAGAILSGTSSSAGTITNCTIANNVVSGSVGGIKDYTGTITNTILWGNTDDGSGTTEQAQISGGTPTVNYSCVQDGVIDENHYTGTGANNIDDDPVFISTSDYHISSSSLCRNVGDPDGDYVGQADIDGQARVIYDRVDIGADEEASAIIFVDDDASSGGDGSWESPYQTIPDALGNSSAGDVIIVAPGTYLEFNFNNNAVRVMSTNPDDPAVVAATVINPGNTSLNAITFNQGETSTSILEGFTVTGGQHGIFVDNMSSPTIRKCVLTANDKDGIYITNNSFPLIDKCTLSSNREDGITNNAGSYATITDCIIINNKRYGCNIANNTVAAIIQKCTIRDNWSYGLYNYHGKLNVENGLIINNSTGIYFAYSDQSNNSLSVVNCTVIGHYQGIASTAPAEKQIIKNSIIWYNTYDLTGCSATYSCIQDSSESDEGVIHDYPMFLDFDGPDNIPQTGDEDYRLWYTSPCIAHNGGGGDDGHEMGAYGNTSNEIGWEDMDGDGLHDEWERTYWTDGIENHGPDGHEDQPTSDGLSNLIEFNNGPNWDPTKNDAIYIEPDTATGYTTIQAAINASSDGDTIVVPPRDYIIETINFNSRNVHLKSINPNDPAIVNATVITPYRHLKDTNPAEAVVMCKQGETAAVLDGFNIHTTSDARGILMQNGALSVSNCIINYNYWGIVIGQYDGIDYTMQIDNCTISQNDTTGISGSVSTGTGGSCDIDIVGCTIASNGTQGVSLSNVNLTVQNSIFSDNGNGGEEHCGLYFNYEESTNSLEVINCSFYGNEGGIYGDSGASSDKQIIKNSILWDTGDALRDCQATYSCIDGPEDGEGVTHADPLFVDSLNGNFHLHYASPCIDAGDSSDYSNEPDYPAGKINMGAYGNTSEATIVVDENYDGQPGAGDGISDDWQAEHWSNFNSDIQSPSIPGHPELSWAPDADSDGDGLSNLDEYYLYWDPQSDDSANIIGLVTNLSSTPTLKYPGIMSAISHAESGDILQATAGTYPEQINFNGRSVHLKGADPTDPSLTTITYSVNGQHVVTFENGETSECKLEGFTITGGLNNCSGISITNSSAPEISKCIITANKYYGITVSGSSPTITNCTISGNGNAAFGFPGIWTDHNSSLTITGCIVRNNYAGGINFGYIDGVSSPMPTGMLNVTNCTIINNYGSGIICNENMLSQSLQQIKNCIIWNNGNDLVRCRATYSCIQDLDIGEGVIHAPPQFMDESNDDYRLWYASPCIGAGDDGHEMGAYGNTSNETPWVDTEGGTGDGLHDLWELTYFPDLSQDKTGDPDNDTISNWAEYLYRYHPNDTQNPNNPSMQIIFNKITPSVQPAQFDPRAGENVEIEYWINQDADNVNMSIYTVEATPSLIKTIPGTFAAGINTVTWDGTNNAGTVVNRGLYDFTIITTNPDATYATSDYTETLTINPLFSIEDYDVNNQNNKYPQYNPYQNLPVQINCDILEWGKVVVKVREASEGPDIYSFMTDDWICPGTHTFEWYGYDMNSDLFENENEALDNFEVYADGVSTKYGVIPVWYDKNALNNLRCNPYRILPLADEVSVIKYHLDCDADVTIDIYEPNGNWHFTILPETRQLEGDHQVIWHGRDDTDTEDSYVEDPFNSGATYVTEGKYVSVASEGVYRIEITARDANDNVIGTVNGSITVFE